MADDEISLFPLIAIALGVLLLVGVSYYVKNRVKQLFRGFKGLQTERKLGKFLRRTGLETMIDKWNKSGGRPSKRLKKHALFSAAEEGRFEDVKFLVMKGADVNAESEGTGRNALMRAAQNGHFEIVQFLIQRGAKINQKSSYSGKTALMRAAQSGHSSIAALLIEKGADINLRSSISGKTALMRACDGGHYEVAEFLLQKGAQVNAIDKNGRTALDHCMKSDFQDVATLLVEWGGVCKSQHEETSSNT